MKISVLDKSTLGSDIDLTPVTSMGEVRVYEKTLPEEVGEHIGDSEVVILNKVKLNEGNLSCCKNLKLICITATGFDNVDLEYCKKRGIAVCNVCGYSTDSVAQLTVSIVLALVMHLPVYDRYVKDGSYTKSGVQNCLAPTYHEISNMTWGIVGYGNIGKKVADVARAFGCNVIFYKKTPSVEDGQVDLDTLLKESDIVTVHLPLSDETKGILSREKLELMKKTAILVNAARGAVIDERAVTDAVLNQTLAGFGTDVYSVEPLGEESPYNEILDFSNVIFTPHMAWGAFEARARCIDEIKKNILAFYNGEIRNRVDL